MASTKHSQKCLKAGQDAIASHNYKAAHSLAINRLHEEKNDPAPYFILGRIAEEHGNTAKTQDLFKGAATLAPESIFYQSHYARLLSIRGEHNSARTIVETLNSQSFNDSHLADQCGVILSRAGEHENAVPYFQRAIHLNPKPDNFHYNLAAALQFSGEFDQAEMHYKKAIARNPNNVRAYSSLIGLRKQTHENNALPELKRLFEKHQESEDLTLHIGHAIAKTYEDLNAFEESLKWLIKAKSKKHSMLNYDLNRYLGVFDAARTSFTTIPKQENLSDAAPVFIIGLPRTGTTLVDRILSSHREVISCGELSVMADLIKSATHTSSSIVLDAETIEKASHLNLSKIGQSYWFETEKRRKGHVRMTDKMPLNFFYAGLIHKALPNARIICLRRGAMDSCLSNYRQLFSTSYSYYNYTLSLEDTGAYYKAFDKLMTYWRSVLPPDRFMEVKYEDIVFDQENQTRRLLDFCGLEWDEACMRFHENKAAVSTASSVQVRQPLYSGSIGRWKKYGDKLNVLRDVLGELAE